MRVCGKIQDEKQNKSENDGRSMTHSSSYNRRSVCTSGYFTAVPVSHLNISTVPLKSSRKLCVLNRIESNRIKSYRRMPCMVSYREISVSLQP